MNNDELKQIVRWLAIEQARVGVLIQTRQDLQDILSIIRLVRISADSCFNGFYSGIKEFQEKDQEGNTQYQRFNTLCTSVFSRFTPPTYGLFPSWVDKDTLKNAFGCFESMVPFTIMAIHECDIKAAEKGIMVFMKEIDSALDSNA